MKETIEIPDDWYKEHTIPELITLRDDFIDINGKLECTCDNCLDVTRCGCAYDAYNTNGDCLLSK